MKGEKMTKTYYDAWEVAEMMGTSKATAYTTIKKLNKELEDKGYITIAGKISKKYFHERTYGCEIQEVN